MSCYPGHGPPTGIRTVAPTGTSQRFSLCLDEKDADQAWLDEIRKATITSTGWAKAPDKAFGTANLAYRKGSASSPPRSPSPSRSRSSSPKKPREPRGGHALLAIVYDDAASGASSSIGSPPLRRSPSIGRPLPV